MMMFIRRWFRPRRHRREGLTIELVKNDRISLGSRICNLDETDLGLLQWSSEQRQALYTGLMARNPKGYDGWHPHDDQLVPVTLPPAQWRMVERVCGLLVQDAPEEWLTRVIARIRAGLASPGAPADHR